jgi:hypothetical protein
LLRWEVTLISTNAVIDTGLTLEAIDLSKVTHLPVRLLGYEGQLLVRTIVFSNVVLRWSDLPVAPKRDVVVLPGKGKGEVRERDRTRSGAYEAPDRGRSVNQEVR